MTEHPPSAIWLEVTAQGAIRRASDDARGLLQAFNPPIETLAPAVERRVDLAGALDRKAGQLRLDLGRGTERVAFHATVSPGRGGLVHLALSPPEGDEDDPTRLLAAWADQGPNGVLIVSADGCMLHANPAFCRLVGFEPGELQGVDFSALRPSSGSEDWEGLELGLAGGGSWTGVVKVRHSSGRAIPLRASITAVRDPFVTHYVGFYQDHSEDAESEALALAESLSSASSLVAAGIAHEVNNLANEVLAWAEEALSGDRSDGTALRSALEREQALGLALGQLGLQLLRLAGEQSDSGPADLAEVARDVAWTLTRLSRGARPIRLEAVGPGPYADVEPSALCAVAQLLGTRAVETLDARRAITIEVFETEAEVGGLRLRYAADATERERLRRLLPGGPVLSVAGNALLRRALEAGLSLELVEDGGNQVELVVSGPLVFALPAEEETFDTAGGSRFDRALVVEDNDDLRELVARALETRFGSILSAEDGEEGLARLEAVGGQVDLVVTDVVLPRLDGPGLVAALRQRWAHPRVVFMSGAAVGEEVREQIRPGLDAFLQKPFRLGDLLAQVDSLLFGAS